VSLHERREMAYWMTLAFRLEGQSRRAINGLVLTADRKKQLGLLDLVRMNSHERPAEILRFASTLDQLLEAEGRVSAQAFLVDRLLSMGCRIVPITDPSYPPHLAHRIGPGSSPTVLSVVGDPDIWRIAGVAISGSRKSGPAGLMFAREAGRAVALAGGVVVCGLAAGVDQQALEGALESGGRVLGVAAEGILQSRWSRRHEVREGRLAIVTEFAPDDRWTAGRAMARNRTIAGFSSALVIADCVASGGTTDQLEAHRSAGLSVYVRNGPGQGALVEELCRRPGVTPWYWRDGPVVWPPQVGAPPAEASAPRVDCIVTLSPERVEIHVNASRQLMFDSVIDSIRDEYRRAMDQSVSSHTSGPDSGSSRVSEAPPPEAPTPIDAVLGALARAGSDGATARDLEQLTELTAYRVRKRLNELLDARLVSKSGHRYYDVAVSPGDQSSPPDARASRRKKLKRDEPKLWS